MNDWIDPRTRIWAVIAVLGGIGLFPSIEMITVREQARSIYSKAGLTGRTALSAFFLEDLLAPIEGLE
ncbi:MAG: hypothetical protein ACREXU_01485 [Gammaproteobacteria bacterium]